MASIKIAPREIQVPSLSDVEAHLYVDGFLRLRVACPCLKDYTFRIPAFEIGEVRPGVRLALRLASGFSGDELGYGEHAIEGSFPESAADVVTWEEIAAARPEMHGGYVQVLESQEKL